MATKRADGRWQGKFTYEGKTYYVFAQKKGDISAAIEKKKEELASRTEEHANPLLDNYYEMFTNFRRASVKASTIRSQTSQYNDCADVVLPDAGKRLGDMRIRDIRPNDVRFVQQALVDAGKSSTTVNNCMDHLKHVFNVAIKDETVDKNPCVCLEPIRRTTPPARETKHRALSEEETAAFIEASRDSYYFNIFRIMLNTGMRIGEVGALSLEDIDERRGCIHLTKTVSRNEAGGYEIIIWPKTNAGWRDIPLNDSIRAIIADQRKQNAQIFGIRFDGLLFPSAEGCILREYEVNREIKRIYPALGLEHFTSHAFRDTFATRWMEQRPWDFKILSEVLGHSDVKVTLNLYAHVMKDKKQEAMNGLQIII